MVAASTHNTLDRAELQKVIELCADTITETSCLMLDSTAIEIIERLDTIQTALFEAESIVSERIRLFAEVE